MSEADASSMGAGQQHAARPASWDRFRRDRNSRTSREVCASCGVRDGRVVSRYTRKADALQLYVCDSDCLQRAEEAAGPVIW